MLNVFVDDLEGKKAEEDKKCTDCKNVSELILWQNPTIFYPDKAIHV